MADDTESYFVSLAVQRGLATREAAQECLDLARTPRAGGRSVLHLLVERARIPTDTARSLHQEAVAMATQARARGDDLQRWVSASSSSSSVNPPPSANFTPPPGGYGASPQTTGGFGTSPGFAPTPRLGPTGTVMASGPHQPGPRGSWPSAPEAPGSAAAPGSVLGRVRTFSPGETFGRYRLESELGRGGMGVVWRGRQLDLDRPVAIKMLMTGTSADDRRRKRFLAEAKAVARLVHPNIVAIHDVGEHEGVLYFTMDLVEGPSLADAIKPQPFPVRRALEVARGIADGLAAAHAQKLVHRDLKPANILLDARGTPRITDFGIAKDLEAAESHTITGEVLGTPAYMPPEQADGRTHLVDGRADVYALGAILYRMIAGRPPFEGSTPYDVITKVLTAEPTPLRKLDKAVPQEVEALVARCLQKDREARYPTAEALDADLARALERLAPARAERRPARAGRSGGPLIAGAVVVALLGVAVGVAGWWRARKEAADHAAKVAADDAARRAALADRLRAEAAARRAKAVERVDQARAREVDSPPEALALAREAAELAPDLVDAQAALGRLLLAVTNDARAACAALDRALELDADHVAARAARARCYLQLDRPFQDVEAEASHLERLGTTGRSAAAEVRAEVALRKGELPVAVVHLDEAVQLDAKNAPLRLRLAELLLRARRFSAADEEATSTLRLDRSADALVVRATARKELGRSADALADAQEALKLAPEHDAARRLVKALEPPPTQQPAADGEHGTHESVHAALRGLKVALARRDSQEATRQLRLALEMQDVPCAGALLERAQVLLEVRQYQLAVADLDRLEQLQGETLNLHLLRATALQRMDRLDEAERSLSRAVELAPDDWRPRELRARLLEERGQLERAQADWDAVVGHAPEAERAWLVHERAHFFHRQKQHERALADMDEALDKEKAKGHLWLVRAEVHADMGHTAQALDDLKEALRVGLSPNEEQRARQKLAELSR